MPLLTEFLHILLGTRYTDAGPTGLADLVSISRQKFRR